MRLPSFNENCNKVVLCSPAQINTVYFFHLARDLYANDIHFEKSSCKSMAEYKRKVSLKHTQYKKQIQCRSM